MLERSLFRRSFLWPNFNCDLICGCMNLGNVPSALDILHTFFLSNQNWNSNTVDLIPNSRKTLPLLFINVHDITTRSNHQTCFPKATNSRKCGGFTISTRSSLIPYQIEKEIPGAHLPHLSLRNQLLTCGSPKHSEFRNTRKKISMQARLWHWRCGGRNQYIFRGTLACEPLKIPKVLHTPLNRGSVLHSSENLFS